MLIDGEMYCTQQVHSVFYHSIWLGVLLIVFKARDFGSFRSVSGLALLNKLYQCSFYEEA